MVSTDDEKPWEKSEESLKTRVFFFIAGSIATLILVIALFANNYYSIEFVVTISIIGGLILLSALIILAIKVQRDKKAKSHSKSIIKRQRRKRKMLILT